MEMLVSLSRQAACTTASGAGSRYSASSWVTPGVMTRYTCSSTMRQSRGLLLLVGALAVLTLLHWASALGGGAHANAQMGTGLLQHLDAMRQTNRRLTAELDRSRAAQAAAQSAAQTTERVLREENAQLKADRDAALAKAAQSALREAHSLQAQADLYVF